MLTLTLGLLLSQSPSIASSPRSAYLVAQAEAPAPVMSAPAAPPVSVQQLQVDIAALKRMRPGIGGGIALVAAGGGLALAGAFYLALGAGVSTEAILIMGIVALSIGAPLAVIGIWLLVNAVTDRARINEEIGTLQREINQRQQVPASPSFVPLPQGAAGPRPLTLARF